MLVDRGRHGDDINVAVREIGDLCRVKKAGRIVQFDIADFERRVMACSQPVDAERVDVVADDFTALAELDGKR